VQRRKHEVTGFGRLQRDVAGKALGHHHIDLALANVVALDEAFIADRQVEFAQQAGSLLHLFDALDLLHANVQQSHGRLLKSEEAARHGLAHDGELDQLELDHLRDELAEMASRGTLPKALRGLPAVVDLDEPMGSDSLVWLTLAGRPLSARASAEHGYRPRQPVSLGFDLTKASLFDTASEQRL